MHILLLGATGRTGRRVFAAAKAAGHRVTAHGRRAVAGADEEIGGAWTDPAIAEAAREADAVVSCLASSNGEGVCSAAAEAVLRADPGVRYVTVAGAGVDRPEDEKGLGDKAIGLVMRLTVGKMLADRQREVDMLAASGAEWTAMRPPRLTEGRATGRWTFTFDRPAATSIDREDLAGAILEVLGREDMVRRAPFVSAAR
ncbi:putative NADH-flavin reductase [Hasllibacter halocynthiae]|uniref:Putative NADH-flavin reductase n=1 Tax=Hasllibacter halocynthiae TaxID=595589 RepID=A0A2T0X101_9RHOB|nr:NAD(P)H-binding protein [Hasllibacter halocynthiae]PRY92626.1 putative NADH-flavin reductase [Hasllibacter halocynthiae]